MGWLKTLARNVLPGFVSMKLTEYPPSHPMRTATSKGGTLDLAHELPETINMLAGGVADYADDVWQLENEAYALIRRCPPIVAAVLKAGASVARLDWKVQGGNPARQEAFKELFDATEGWVKYFQWMSWALFEGYRVMQIKRAPMLAGERVVPTWSMGGRRKYKAGPGSGKGTVHWDGVNLYKIQQYSGVQISDTLKLPRDQFAIFRPGAGSNPEGDMELGLIGYDIADSWRWGRININDYTELFGTPKRAIERKLDKVRPGNVQNLLRESAERLEENWGSRSILSHIQGEAVKLLKPEGNGLQDLWGSMREMAGIIWQLILFTKLTQDTADAGPTGSSTVGLSEKDTAMLVLAMEHADTINTDIVPWYVKNNPWIDQEAPLADDEQECYFWPEPPSSGDAMDVDTDPNAPKDPLAEFWDRVDGDRGGNGNGNGKHKGNGNGKPPVNRLPGVRQLSVRDPLKQLAKPAAMVLPPVHPNCRCVIDDEGEGATGMWLDAADGKVCSECRAYGAVFNALERGNVKLSDAEADAILDERNSREFKAALEGDVQEQQRAIVRAQGSDTEGILQQVTRERGIVPSPTELEDAIDVALDQSRAVADVQAGVTIGTGARGFVTPEAIVAPRVTIGVGAASQQVLRPEFVGAVVSSGKRYSVIRTMGRTRIIDKRRDRSIAVEWSLFGALLLFAALEERERRQREEARQRERNTNS